MPIAPLNLCRQEPPDGCCLSSGAVLEACRGLLPKLEALLGLAVPLRDCNSNAKAVREGLLKRFSFPEHKDDGRVIARGMYVLFDGAAASQTNAFYVGVANDVPKRLVNHLYAKSHHTSSLVYLLMKRHLPDEARVSHEKTKNGEPKRKKRADLFADNSNNCLAVRDHLLANCSVVILPVPDVVTLHLFEALVAVEFRTGPWNSFRPH